MEDYTGLVIFLIIALVVGTLIFCFVSDQQEFDSALSSIDSLKYDVGDVEVFLKSFDYSPKDFLQSHGLQKQYENWRDGKDSSGQRLSVLSKKASERAAANSAAAMGMSAASMAMSASR